MVAAPRLARALADPVDAQARALALQRVRREVPEDFAALAEAFKRAKNILAQAAPSRLGRPEAVRGGRRARSASRPPPALEKAAGSYEDRLRGLASLRAPVGRFFDDVLVMAEDPRVRGNRLAFSIRRSRSSIASRTFPVSEVARDSVRLLLRRRQGRRQQGHEGHCSAARARASPR